MATSTDIQISSVETETSDAVTSNVSESTLSNSYTEEENNESSNDNKKLENAQASQTYLANDKISTSWNNLETENSSSPTTDARSRNGSYVNSVKPPNVDCKQNIIDQSMLLNPETWTVGGESPFWFDNNQYNNNKFQSYDRKIGSYKTNSSKNCYNQPATSNRQFNHQGSSSCPQLPRGNNTNAMNYTGNGQHVVHLHVNPGEIISFYMGDHMQLIQGPATVRMVSNNSTPPVPMPVQVPPGHMVQQIVDEQGTLRHIILSVQPPVAVSHPYSASTSTGHVTSASSGPAPFYLYPPQTFSVPSNQFQLHMQPGLHSPNEHLQSMANHNQSSNPVLSDPLSSHLSAFKDERTQRQFVKLKKRLEARQKDSSTFTPPSNNVSHAKSCNEYNQRENEECNEEENPLLKVLSLIKAPSIVNITCRSALIKWLPLELKDESDDVLTESQKEDLMYIVLLCDNKDNKPQVTYKGCDIEYLLKNLKPAISYHVCVQAAIKDLSGNPSEKIEFTTLSCEPEAPQSPKLQSRTKTSISLKWNAAVDNGSKILSYNLEFDEGSGTSDFVELFSGLQKQYKVVKLKASTCYKFRLSAINENGKSGWSETSCFSTSGSIPSQPLPPVLEKAGVYQLLLAWEARPNDDSYTLQMDDSTTLHGFLPVYNGRDALYTCSGLNRNTSYKFRLCAINEEGTGPWSPIVEFFTLPDQPGCPSKPHVKGKLHSTSFKLAWEAPKDNGGSPITSYNLEMGRENGFESIYTGDELEYVCEHLQPGTTYTYQVQCISSGGRSTFSEIGSVTTSPVVPGMCSPPKLLGKPKPSSLQLKWVHPEYDGGSEVQTFEIEVTYPDGSVRTAYKGHGADCVVAGLQAGRQYQFRVRAYNKVGHGLWSDDFESTSGAGVPDSPADLQVVPRSSHCMFVSWTEPPSNGASITEYHLEFKHGEEDFELVYSGSLCNAEVKSLIPAMTYYYQVQAINVAGAGPFCECVSCDSPPSSPSSVATSNSKAIVGATTIALSWTEPNDHGSPIVHYNIDVGDVIHMTSGQSPEVCIEGLAPETTYKVRIQAVNSVGPGSYSSSLKLVTRGLPPTPPALECTGASHNSIRLKWGDGKNPDFKTYTVEMENPHFKRFAIIYQGNSQSFKVSKLQEVTSYNFRICASNEEGDGPFSEICTFKTQRALPASPKAPKVLAVNVTSAAIEWMPSKPIGEDHLSYKLHLSTSKESDYQVAYNGTDTHLTLTDLIPSTEYTVRIVAVRHTSMDGELPSPFSPTASFTTSLPECSRNSPPKMMSVVSSLRHRQPLTDQQWAVIILCGFTFFAICVAILIERILSYTTS